MTQMATAPGLFVSAFEQLDTASPLQSLRQSAFDRFQTLGLPTLRDEPWRYTSVKKIGETNYETPAAATVAASDLAPFEFDGLDAHRLVFVNGQFDAERSHIDGLPSGIRVGSLARFAAENPDAITSWLAARTPVDHQAFIALNTALMEDGAFVHVPAGTQVDKPIHAMFVTVADGRTTHTAPRILIVAEANAEVTVVEQHAGLDAGHRLTNAVTEIIALENAQVDYYRVQRENLETAHFSGLLVSQEQDSRVTCHSSMWGGSLVPQRCLGLDERLELRRHLQRSRHDHRQAARGQCPPHQPHEAALPKLAVLQEHPRR